MTPRQWQLSEKKTYVAVNKEQMKRIKREREKERENVTIYQSWSINEHPSTIDSTVKRRSELNKQYT